MPDAGVAVDEFGWTKEARHDFMLEAIAIVYRDWERMSEAKTPLDFAQAITELSNSMHALVSWHHDWDWEHGILRGGDKDA